MQLVYPRLKMARTGRHSKWFKSGTRVTRDITYAAHGIQLKRKYFSHFMVINFDRNRKQRIKMGIIHVTLSYTKLKYLYKGRSIWVSIYVLPKFPLLVSSLKGGCHVLTQHCRYDEKIFWGMMNLTDYMTHMISLSMVKRLDHESSLNPIAVIAKQYATFKLSKKKKERSRGWGDKFAFFFVGRKEIANLSPQLHLWPILH